MWRIATAVVLASVAAASAQTPTFVFRVTVQNPGVQSSTLDGSFTSGTNGAVNTFDNVPASLASSNGYTAITSSNYTRVTGGTTTATTGIDARSSYSAGTPGASVAAADQYGGAGGTGRYLIAGPYTGAVNTVTLQLSQTAYYFGYWWSALDTANRIEFYKGTTLVDVLDAGRLINFLPNTYKGNPTANFSGQDPNELFAFANVYDDRVGNAARGFDRVVIANSSTGTGNETDNHTFSFSTAVPTALRADETLVPVPEPAGLLAAAGGLLVLVRRLLRS